MTLASNFMQLSSGSAADGLLDEDAYKKVCDEAKH